MNNKKGLSTILNEVIDQLFPDFALQNTPWLSIWNERRVQAYNKKVPIIFSIIAFAYVFHHFFVDKPLGLDWANYRFGCAGLALSIIGIHYCFNDSIGKYQKLPSMIAFLVFSFYQAKTVVWYSEVPYIYALVMVFILTVTLQMNLFKSLLFASLGLALQLPSFLEAQIDQGMVISAIIVTLIIVTIARLPYLDQIKVFLAERRNEETQMKLIETNKEYTEYVQKFLPPEISNRIRFLMKKGASVLTAVDEVLRPERRTVVALRCDIRNFTTKSKSIDYINSFALPEIKIVTDIIDNSRGISRKIGDLVFAYYDFDDNFYNLLNAIRAGILVHEKNSRFNQHSEDTVERQILISSGLATVGNIGDIGSSIEITALGNPVNFVARMEDYVKIPKIKEQLPHNSIYIDSETYFTLSQRLPDLEIQSHQIDKKIRIKDFTEVESIYILAVNQHNTEIINQALLNYTSIEFSTFDRKVTWKGVAA
ncbi:MAG: hypothetical protein HRT44_02040 [Bdellovibrionales bacterium]|nr:hypothetical protein [Bdellovibrionales bacterium]NQZ18027.1 hypothetical protein [Bdellovibrionales bacterium]